MPSSDVQALCAYDKDWPQRLCYDELPMPSIVEIRNDWDGYYKFKGEEWMKMKKTEMDDAIRNATLKEWVYRGQDSLNFTNHNVWYYYFINDRAPAYPGYTTAESSIEKAKSNIIPVDFSIEAPDLVIVKKGESIQIPIIATIPKDDDTDVKMAIVADGQEAVFYTTGQEILPEGFSALRTGSLSWRGASESVHLKIFFELRPSWDVSLGSYTLSAALSGHNSAVSKSIQVNVLDNLKVGFPKTNVTEIYHLSGNYYTPDRELEYQDFKIPYRISNGTLKEIKVEQLNESLAVNVESTGNGVLEIDIPRNLFDQKFEFIGNFIDDQFLVFIDGGEEVKYTEFKTPCFRNLSINFQEGAKTIAIVGMNFLMGPEPFASDVPPIYLVTNSKNYTKGDTITIFGCTSLGIDGEKMIFDIADNGGRNIKSQSITPNLDGTFLYELETGKEFVTDGNYTIQTTYGNHTNTRTVVVPEFPIAGLILVASMVTILIITRTKWNPI